MALSSSFQRKMCLTHLPNLTRKFRSYSVLIDISLTTGRSFLFSFHYLCDSVSSFRMYYFVGEWWNTDPEAVITQALQNGGGPNVSDAYTINGLPGPLYNCSAQGTSLLTTIIHVYIFTKQHSMHTQVFNIDFVLHIAQTLSS